MAKKILLIEGDTALAGSIAGALHARGAEVALARDAVSAVDVARGERPDGIVLCAELPGGSGFVVCNKLRKDPELREIPLLLTSADASDETFEQHRKLKTRADSYLRKPFAISALLAQLAPLAGLPEPTPGAPDDEDLLAFDAAFDSIAQVDEAGAPIDRPISADEVDAAAALVADLPDVEEPPPAPPPPAPAPAAVAAAPAAPAADPAVLQGLRAELARLRAELDAAKAAHAELSQRLAAEQTRARDGEAQVAAERERIRSVLVSALAELERS
jgi:CheY-like chemotaxis protein